MATGWLTALKMVPWTDVVKNAPLVADGARRLWKTVAKTDAPEAPAPQASAAPGPHAFDDRLAALERRTTALQRENASAAELMTALAEQNTQLVGAVAALRARLRLLTVAATVFATAAAVAIGALFVL